MRVGILGNTRKNSALGLFLMLLWLTGLFADIGKEVAHAADSTYTGKLLMKFFYHDNNDGYDKYYNATSYVFSKDGVVSAGADVPDDVDWAVVTRFTPSSIADISNKHEFLYSKDGKVLTTTDAMQIPADAKWAVNSSFTIVFHDQIYDQIYMYSMDGIKVEEGPTVPAHAMWATLKGFKFNYDYTPFNQSYKEYSIKRSVDSFVINNGEAHTNQEKVTLHISASPNIVEMQVSNDGTWSNAWEPLQSSKEWNLTSGEGEKTVYLKLRDAQLNEKILTQTIILEQTPPKVYGVTDGETYKAPVTLSWDEGIAVLDGERILQGHVVKKKGQHTLEVTDEAGNKTTIIFTMHILTGKVLSYFGFPFDENEWANSYVYSTDGVVSKGDDVPDNVDWAVVAGYQGSTNAIDLEYLYSKGGVVYKATDAMQIPADARWATLSSFTLYSKQIFNQTYVYSMDGMKEEQGNTVPVGAVWATLKRFNHFYDMQTATYKEFLLKKPFESLTINNGATHTNKRQVILQIGATDGTKEMQVSNDDTVKEDAWEPLQSSKEWTLSEGDGEKTVYLMLRDQENNTRIVQQKITLDQTPPKVDGATDGGSYKGAVTLTWNEGTGKLDGNPVSSGHIVKEQGNHMLVVTDEAGNVTKVAFIVGTSIGKVMERFHDSGNNALTAAGYVYSLDGIVSAGDVLPDKVDWVAVAGYQGGAASTSSPEYLYCRGGKVLSATDAAKIPADARWVALSSFAINGQPISGQTYLYSRDGNQEEEGTAVPADAVWATLAGFHYGSGEMAEPSYKRYTIKRTSDWFAINSGATHTNQQQVTLHINASDGMTKMQVSNDGIAREDEWEPLASSKEWTLADEDGEKTVYLMLQDQEGHTKMLTQTITLDRTPPIVEGAEDGGIYREVVSLTWNEGTGELDGKPISSGHMVREYGQHTLVVTDRAGNETKVIFTMKTIAAQLLRFFNIPDTGESFEAASYVYSKDGVVASGNDVPDIVDWAVVASLKGSGAVSDPEYLYSKGGKVQTASDAEQIPADAKWAVLSSFTVEAYTISNKLYLYSRDGIHAEEGDTVPADAAWATLKSFQIYSFDIQDQSFKMYAIKRSFDWFDINKGATHTNQQQVTLQISASDGMAEMQVSNNDTWSDDAWEPLNISKAWSLSAGEGEKTVYLMLRDQDGHTKKVKQTIILDQTPPVISGASEGGSYRNAVALSWNEGKGMLDGSEIPSGYVVKEYGSHTLAVTDEAGNKTTVAFTMRTKAGKVLQRFQYSDVGYLEAITYAYSKDGVVSTGNDVPDAADWVVAANYKDAGSNVPWPAYLYSKEGKVYTVTDAMQIPADAKWATNSSPNWSGEPTEDQISFLYSMDGIKEEEGATVPADAVWAALKKFPISNGKIIWNQSYKLYVIKENVDVDSFAINDGATHTNQKQVTLRISASDGMAEMQFSNDDTWSDDAWEPLADSKVWTLPAGDGEKSVYLKLRDQDGHTKTLKQTIILDQSPPVVIGAAEGGTYQEPVTLNWNEGMATLDRNEIQPGHTVKEYGTHKLLVKDLAGNVTEITFTLAKSALAGEMLINQGASDTNSRNVTLGITATGGIGKVAMRLSNDGQNWEDWEPVQAARSWTLTEGDGQKTVYMEMKDEENTIVTESDSIVLDTAAPVVTGVEDGRTYQEPVTITFNEGAATLNGHLIQSGETVSKDGTYLLVVTDKAQWVTKVEFQVVLPSPQGKLMINRGAEQTSSTSVVLNIELQNAPAGITMRFSNDNKNWSDWEAYAPVKRWTLDGGYGEKTVYVELKNKQGKVTAASDTIELIRVPSPPPVIPITGVSLNPKEVTLTKDGEPFTLTATIHPYNATNRHVTWSSSDVNIAAVDQNGTVTPKSAGTAVITVTTEDGNKQAAAQVKVLEGTQLETSLSTIRIKPGMSATFKVYALLGGKRVDITKDPETAYETQDKLVAVSPGKVTAGKKEGSTVVKISYKGQTAEISVKVSKANVLSLKISPSKLVMKEGEKLPVRITASYSDRTKKDVTDQVTWSVKDSEIAAVSSTGIVTAKKAGQTEAVADYEGKKKTIKIMVQANGKKIVKEYKLNRSEVELKEKETSHLSLTAYYTDGTEEDLTKKAIWKTANKRVATVSKGVIIGKAAGKTVITASINGQRLKATVTVARKT